MNNGSLFDPLQALGLPPPSSSSGTRAILEQASRSMGLPLVDHMTLRDLVRLSGTDDPELYALLIAMFASLGDGSLCLDLTPGALAKRLERFMPGSPEAVADEILSKIENGKYRSILSDQSDAFVPLIRRGRHLYFQKYFASAKRLADDLKRFISWDRSEEPSDLNTVKDTLSAVIPSGKSSEKSVLNPEQRLAVVLALVNNFVIISGGPGTGKTTMVIAILRALLHRGILPERIGLAAPTGRAAQRLTEAVQAGSDESSSQPALSTISAGTIHRLLRFSPSRNRFYYHRSNKLPLDVVLVDEVSMVDVVLMSRLLAAVSRKAKIILLGDRHQLPSVEAGAIFADLMPGEKPVYSAEVKSHFRLFFQGADLRIDPKKSPLRDRVVFLKKNYRSEPSIAAAADRVNRADKEALSNGFPLLQPRKKENGEVLIPWPVPCKADDGYRCPEGGCFRFPAENSDDDTWTALLHSWARRQYMETGHRYAEKYRKMLERASTVLNFDALSAADAKRVLDPIFGCIHQARILTLTRKGPYGCVAVNRILLDFLKSTLDPSSTGGHLIGTPLLITRNDYRLELYNGDVGVVLSDRKGRKQAVFSSRHLYFSYPVETLPQHEPGFAMTVHKSQGSEFDQVLLVLPDDPEHPLLTREIVYTGLTRARHLAVVYSSAAVLESAIRRKIERETGSLLTAAMYGKSE